MKAARSNERTLQFRIWQQIRPFWRHLAGLLVLSLLAPPLALLTPLPVKIAVDSIIGQQPLPGLLNAMLPEGWQNSPATLLLLAVGLIMAVAVLSQLRDFATN